ncbi:hypothetical protein [Bradyrhizobium sp. SRS-191]|uniref:hypothetical protein n=1 Tax=Bradyrhizobium sp. SRS-191 TaxID=2962606 RepID=UPI00211F434D|nr:hypothetical protein [Bradyrhizobium sp. SRS-191]
MSEQKAEQTSLGTASPGVVGAEPVLKTSASPDVVDKAVPAIAPVAQPMISPDHEAPSADQPAIVAKTAAAEAPASEPKAEPVAALAATEAHPATETKAEVVKLEAAKTDEIKTDETKAGPPPVESAKAEVSKPEPKRLDLVKSDKGKSENKSENKSEKKADMAKADPLKLNAGQSSSSQIAAKSPPTILDLIRTEPAKPAEPVKTATAAGDLLKVETPKLSTLASNAPKIGPMGTTAAKPDAPVKPETVSKPASVKPDVAVKSEAVAKPEPVVKPELAAKPEPTVKPDAAVKPEAVTKVEAKRPAVESAPVSKAGMAGAAVDKATAWARAKLKAEPFTSNSAAKPAPAAAAMAAGAAAALPPKPPGNSAARLPASARLGLPAMAAVLLLAMVVGGVAGGLVTATLVDRSGGGTAEATGTGTADPTLSAAVSRIDNEIANLKASLEQTNQTSLVELNKSAERLDRLEKVLGELATKASGKPSELQRLSDAVERLRAAQASASSQPSARDTTASVPQAVGAINAAAPPSGVPMRQEASRAEPARTDASTPSRTEPSRAEPARAETARADAARTEAAKPKVVEGWVLRDVGRGGALIEGRGGLYEVYAGDPVPGLGKVDAIRKQDGRWVVFTTKGLVVAR